MLTKYETLEERELYYRNPLTAINIARYCRYREVIIMKHLPDRKMVLRPFKLFKPEHFEWLYDRLHLDKIPFDIYHSNSSIRMPKLPTGLSELKDVRAELNKNWKLHAEGKNPAFITGNDFFCDTDVKTEEQRPQALEYAKTVHNELKRQNIGKPEIWDTGRGYHVIIRGRFNPSFCKNLLIEICNNNDLPYASNGDLKPNIDDKVTGDIRRIRRCEFGLHTKTGKPMRQIKW